MTLKFNVIAFFVLPTSFNCFAQGFLNEKPFEPESIQAPGVERVGAVPLPIPNYSNLPIAEANSSIETTKSKGTGNRLYDSTFMPGRIIYLNGENISSIRNQELEGVKVNIDKSGNIYIDAPQYEVSSEQSYHPLLPKELPQFKKESVYEQLPVPKGTYSKQASGPAPMPKEIIPEVNTKPQIPEIDLSGIKKNDNSKNQE